MLSPAYAAEGDEATFQYGYYEEGGRSLFGHNNQLGPIHVDNLSASAGTTLFDRVKLGFHYIQDTWSGATPATTLPVAGMLDKDPLVSGASSHPQDSYFVDSQFRPYRLDQTTGVFAKDKRLVHMVASASPETRKQGDFKLGYEWDEAALDVGGGVSVERDYNSRFVNMNGRWDLNQKLTTLNLGLSYTASDIAAIMPPAYEDYIDKSAYQIKSKNGEETLRDERQDWTAHFGLSQVINKNAVIETGLGYTRSTGFMENPYKAATFAFVDPKQDPLTGFPGVPDGGLLTAEMVHPLEQRPDVRNQWTWNMRYVQYVSDLDAALHLDYRFYHDDWGIDAHTFAAAWDQPVGNGWTITPQFRYYTQDAANFYQPFFLFKQAKPQDAAGNAILSQVPISHYSSDHRLSGYGALSGGVTVSKQFTKGVSFEAGVEYYNHVGGLKLGGGGEGNYADFNYYLVNAALKVDLSAFAHVDDGHGGHHIGHSVHSDHAPAGVMFDHMMGKAGAVMVGYRYMYGRQAGDMLHLSLAVSDKIIVDRGGCGDSGCSVTPSEMNMQMQMLDLMYAPTDWLSLMLMPQFVDMNMNLRPLKGASPAPPGGHDHGGGGHATGGVGDTGMYALVKLFDVPGHHLQMGLGLSAPTGDVGVKLNGGNFIHYGMQLGSGTWDFRPSLTYTGYLDRWSWGGQVSGTQRLEDKNASGFAFGDGVQPTAWGSYSLLDWLSASVRGVYTMQSAIKGEYNKRHEQSGPMDFPANYGGQYWDVGFGLNAVVTSGELKGNHLSFEWLQPVENNVNGYQLEREGALSVTWGVAF